MIRNIIIFCLLLTFISCTDEWKQHYEDGRGPLQIVDKTVYEYLSDNAQEYSNFVTLLKETKADTLLQEGHRYTVWLTDELPADFDLHSDSVKGLILQNHIMPTEIQSTAFKDNLQMKTAGNKILWLQEETGGKYSVNDNEITSIIAICKDGVIYDIDGFLDRAPTLKESFWEDPEYSTLRYILTGFTDTVLISLEPIVDTVTQEIIYDSIFAPMISIFDKAKIDKDQSVSYTIFLTKNSQLDERINTYFTDIVNVTGDEIVKDDTIKLFNFLAKSFIHVNAIEEENYYAVERRWSAFNNLWRTSFQQIIPGSLKKYSNGYAYEMQNLVIPTTLIAAKSLDLSISAIYDLDPSKVDIHIEEEFKDKVSLKTSVLTLKETRCLEVKAELPPIENAPEYEFSMSWYTAYPELDTLIQEVRYKEVFFTPGEYLVYFSYIQTNNATQDFEVWINDVFLRRVNYSLEERLKPITVNLGRVQLPFGEVAKPIKVTLKNVGSNWKRGLAPLSIKFERTVNNY